MPWQVAPAAGRGAADPKWVSQSIRWKNKLGLPGDFNPFTPSKLFKGRGLNGTTKRTLDLIDCCVMDHCKRAKTTVAQCVPTMSEVLLDFSQCHDRKPFSNDGVARTLTTSTHLYYFGQDRVCIGLEHLLLQGYDKNVCLPETMSESDLRRMAGEGIALPCLALLVWALFVTKGLPSVRVGQ